MEKYVSLAEKVLCAAKDLEVKNVAEGVLQKLADGKAEDAVADGTQIEKALLKNVVEGVINKNTISNCLTDLENNLVAYQNNSTSVAYEEIWDELVKLEESVKELHAVLYKKLNERRMSVHRVRNIAKHRNSLELLNIRRYTGLLKECNQFLADIEAENALLVPKLDKFYRCFRVDNPLDIKDGYAFGIFVPIHPEFPTVVGRIKKSHLGNASTKVEFQINSSLSWEWNDTAKLYDVWKKYS